MAAIIRRRGERSKYGSLSGEKGGVREENEEKKEKRGKWCWGRREGEKGGGCGNSHVARREWLGGFCFAESSHNNTTRPAMSD